MIEVEIRRTTRTGGGDIPPTFETVVEAVLTVVDGAVAVTAGAEATVPWDLTAPTLSGERVTATDSPEEWLAGLPAVLRLPHKHAVITGDGPPPMTWHQARAAATDQ